MDNELKDRVSAIVRETLNGKFKDEFTFEPIAVVEDIDEFIDDEQEYIEIFIVFDGDPERLDPGWTSGFIRHIRPQLIEAGAWQVPIPSFIEKSEWLSAFDDLRRLHPDLNRETP